MKVHHLLAPNSCPSPRQRGQAAVETALLLPALVILLFGIIMTGFTFYAFIQVSNAAREGARAGSLYRITQATSGLTLVQTVRQAIYDPGTGSSALGFLTPTGSSFNVTSDVSVPSPVDVDGDGTISSGDRLTVTVTYRYSIPVLSAFLRVFPQPIVIVRSVEMEIQ